MRVLVIGIDAGCFGVLDRLSEEGTVPAIDAIRSAGCGAPLESQIPPWTPSAWPSVYTGVNPGRHGVYSFVGFDGYDFRLSTASEVNAHRIWTLLDHLGYSSVILNVPVTHPPDDIDGAIIPGFMGPERPPSHPDGILDDVREEIGDYRVYPSYTRGNSHVSDDEKIDEYLRLIRMRGQAFRYLTDRFDPDFGFVEFQKTDTVFHEFDGEWQKVTDVYESTDKQISKIVSQCNPDTLFLVSDHGIGPYKKQEFRVNSYLEDKGYVETQKGGKGMPTWNVMRDQLRDGESIETWEPGATERAAAAAATVGLTANRIGTILEKLGLDEFVKEHVSENVARTGNEQIDFARSTAYMRLRTELGVRINLKGREPDGVVPRHRYDHVLDELIADLRNATAPDGTPVFETVTTREEYYDGPFTEDAVDVVTVPNDFQHFLSAEPADEFFSDSTEPWNHKRHGMFVAMGDAVDTSATPGEPHIFDVAPTVMAAMGLPADSSMDGNVIPVIERAGTRDYPPYDFDLEHTTDTEVEDRLAELGYIE